MDALQTINLKYPQLNLLQYIPLFEEHKILYEETVLKFDVEHFVGLGIPEGAVQPSLVGIQKVLAHEKKEKKRAWVYRKQPSVEV